MEIRREEIVVNGWEKPDVILVRKTRNGVVASDSMVDASRFGAAGDGTEPLALSFAWTGLEPVRTIQSIHMILRSRNWDDFLEAAVYFDTLLLDKTGTITLGNRMATELIPVGGISEE